MRRTLRNLGSALIAGIAALVFAAFLLAFLLVDTKAQTGQASPVPATVTVVATAGGSLLVAANPARHGITFYNQGAVVVSIIPGTTIVPTASGGGTINLAASGGTMTLTCTAAFPCGNSFTGIAASSTSIVSIWEF